MTTEFDEILWTASEFYILKHNKLLNAIVYSNLCSDSLSEIYQTTELAELLETIDNLFGHIVFREMH